MIAALVAVAVAIAAWVTVRITVARENRRAVEAPPVSRVTPDHLLEMWTPEERAAGFGDAFHDNAAAILRIQKELNEIEWQRRVAEMVPPTTVRMANDGEVTLWERER